MEVIHERCAGLDVHKETVVGCLRVRERGRVRRIRLRSLQAGRLQAPVPLQVDAPGRRPGGHHDRGDERDGDSV